MTKAHGPQRRALEKTITSSPILREDAHAALVAFARSMADAVDAAGEEVPTRIAGAYLSTLGHMARTVRDARTASTGKLMLQAVPDDATGARSWRKS